MYNNIEFMRGLFKRYNENEQRRQVANRNEIILSCKNHGYESHHIAVCPTGHFEGKRFVVDIDGPYAFNIFENKDNPSVLVNQETQTYIVKDRWLRDPRRLMYINRLLPRNIRLHEENYSYAPMATEISGMENHDYPRTQWSNIPGHHFVIRQDGTIISGGLLPVRDDVTTEKIAQAKEYRKQAKSWFARMETLRGGNSVHEVFGRIAVDKFMEPYATASEWNANYTRVQEETMFKKLFAQLNSSTPDEHEAYLWFLGLHYHNYNISDPFKAFDKYLKRELFVREGI